MTDTTSPSALQLIREDWERHDRRFTHPGWHALVVHRLQVAAAESRGPVGKLVRTALHAVNILLIRNVYGIELYPTTRVGRGVCIAHHQGVILGRYATIGDGCIIRQHVTLGEQNGSPLDHPTLGRHVNVGPGATMVGGISIGDEAQIGAHALVVRDVPAGATAMISPARVLPGTKASSSTAAEKKTDLTPTDAADSGATDQPGGAERSDPDPRVAG